jgi:hypothetical protein
VSRMMARRTQDRAGGPSDVHRSVVEAARKEWAPGAAQRGDVDRLALDRVKT